MYACSSVSQDKNELLKKIKTELANRQTTISAVLSDASYMFLHPLTEFREIIKQNARAEKIKIVSGSEPGTRIIIRGEVKNEKGEAMGDALIYVYQTSDKGWYSDTAAHVLIFMGDMKHARLFGYLKTDDKGKFEFETIKPKGYPKSDLPAHIHIAMWKNDKYLAGVPGELQFDDDDRMTPERRKRSLQDGNIISKNSGTAKNPIYFYEIICD
jgi:protocatechuate 3,4-dioxygenase beta subunit